MVYFFNSVLYQWHLVYLSLRLRSDRWECRVQRYQFFACISCLKMPCQASCHVLAYSGFQAWFQPPSQLLYGVHGHLHDVFHRGVRQMQKYCRCHSSCIRNLFSDYYLGGQTMVPVHHLKADMVSHPYRQLDTLDHMEAHKHQAHPPCRLQNQHRLLKEYTNSYSCEGEAYFF